MKKISSVENAFIKYLITLQKSKNRHENQQFLVEGWHLVSTALEHQAVSAILIDENQYQKYKDKIPSTTEIYLVSANIIKKIAQTVSPQPIIALCNMSEKSTSETNNVILLDNIQDPSNLGAIIRNCIAFDIKKIYLSDNSVDLYNHKVISASQGAVFKIEVEYCNLIALISKLKAEKYHIFSTFLHEGKTETLDKIKFKTKNAFLFGNEGQGISQTLRSLVDENFIIRTTDNVESLNLAVSIAITIYCLFSANIIK